MSGTTRRSELDGDASSRRLARLVGPTLVAITLPEMEFLQPELYVGQLPSGVFAAGMLWFVAGLAILRDHNLWVRRWPVLLTLVGWAALLGGIARMFLATGYPAAVRTGPGIVVGEVAVIVLGLYLSCQAFRRVHPSGDE